jgi:hypothetical protein
MILFMRAANYNYLTQAGSFNCAFILMVPAKQERLSRRLAKSQRPGHARAGAASRQTGNRFGHKIALWQGFHRTGDTRGTTTPF